MWQGYYEQYGQHSPMKFTSFQANPTSGGLIKANGSDEVGKFKFSGTFSNDGKKVNFTKQYYEGATHQIFYKGNVTLEPPTIEGFWGFGPGN